MVNLSLGTLKAVNSRHLLNQALSLYVLSSLPSSYDMEQRTDNKPRTP